MINRELVLKNWGVVKYKVKTLRNSLDSIWNIAGKLEPLSKIQNSPYSLPENIAELENLERFWKGELGKVLNLFVDNCYNGKVDYTFTDYWAKNRMWIETILKWIELKKILCEDWID